MPPMTHLLATERELHCDLLRLGVARHDGFRRFLGLLRGALPRICSACSDARLHIRHRHRHADAPGAADQNLRFRQVQLPSRDRSHFARVLHALLAGAGIGVAGVHHDGLRLCLASRAPHKPSPAPRKLGSS
jgi:hypothetical protein